MPALRTLYWVGLIIFFSGIVGFFTSYFIVSYITLSAVFLGWVATGMVLLAVSSSRNVSIPPKTLLKSYGELIHQLLDEYGIDNVYPYFTPSRVSKTASMLLPIGENIVFERIPRRILIPLKDGYAVRVETLGSFFLEDYGYEAGAGLAVVESSLKSILIIYLSSVKDIVLDEADGGDKVIVRVKNPDDLLLKYNNPANNLLVQIIGPYLAEALDKTVRLEKLEVMKKEVSLSFMVGR